VADVVVADVVVTLAMVALLDPVFVVLRSLTMIF
jgi:hypothetical protein